MMEVVFLHIGAISVSQATPFSLVTQLTMVEGSIQKVIAMWTSVGTPLS